MSEQFKSIGSWHEAQPEHIRELMTLQQQPQQEGLRHLKQEDAHHQHQQQNMPQQQVQQSNQGQGHQKQGQLQQEHHQRQILQHIKQLQPPQHQQQMTEQHQVGQIQGDHGGFELQIVSIARSQGWLEIFCGSSPGRWAILHTVTYDIKLAKYSISPNMLKTT